jgi:hypothetical protein
MFAAILDVSGCGNLIAGNALGELPDSGESDSYTQKIAFFCVFIRSIGP